MSIFKLKINQKKALWMCLLVLMATLFFSGVVLADSDLPGEPPTDSTPAVEETLPAEEVVDEPAPSPDEIDDESPELDEPVDEEVSADEGGEDPQPVEDPASGVDEPDPGDESETPDVDAADNEAGDEAGDEAGETSPAETAPAEEPVVEIVNQDGEAVTQDSGSLSSGSDPRWKVGTTWYSVVTDEGSCYTGTSVGAGTCWVSSTPITTALTKIEEGLLPSDKKLYIDEGTFDEGDILISGVYLSQLNGLIGSGSETTTIIGTITLDGNKGGFTFSGLTITGGIVVENSAGNLVMTDMNVSNPDGNGLEVGLADGTPEHNGSVTISDSSFNQSENSGALIKATSTVTITNSTFNNNGISLDGLRQTGLYISTTGVINLNGVTASANYGRGIDIGNFSALTAKNIITNSNESYFSYDGDGFYVYPGGILTGKVTLENIEANNNGHFGIYINGMGIVSLKNVEAVSNGDSGIDVQTSNAVTIKGAHVENNSAQGIYIASAKTVTLNSIISKFNGANGVLIEGWGSTYPTLVTISSPKSGGAVSANYFENNGMAGMDISVKGNILISNTDSNDNAGWGMKLDNCLKDNETGLCTSKGNVTINTTISNWKNGINSNGGYGIWVLSNGMVSISQTSAAYNNYEGFYVDTRGAIKLNTTEASNNNKNGAYLTNLSAPKAQTVSILDSTFNQNNGMGVYVLTAGAITFNGSSATENYSPAAGGPLEGSVTIEDNFIGSDGRETWGFYGNAGDEIDIIVEVDDFQSVVTLYNSIYEVIASESGNYNGNYTRITLTLTESDWYRIEVSYSGDYDGMAIYTLMFNDPDRTRVTYPGSGAVLDNSAGKANVTVSTTSSNLSNTFDGNASYGLKIISNGNISLTNPNAANNSRSGVSLENPASKGNVTVLDKNAELSNVLANNGWSGLAVSTLGNIVLNGISAQENFQEGFHLDNCQYASGSDTCLGKGNVTLSNLGAFNNGGTGLYVFSAGNLSLKDVDSSDNNSFGITLDNRLGNRNVTLKNVSSNNNNDTGINILSNGQVTLSAIIANNNFKTSDSLGVGEAVSDYYNADVSADQWGFDAETGEEYTIRLYASDDSSWDVNNFIGNLTLYDGEGNEISFDSVSGAGTNELIATWTASDAGYYTVEVTERSGNSGFYRLGINNENFGDMTYYYVDGLYIQTAKNVIFSGKDTNDLSHNSLTGLFLLTQGNISLLNVQANSNGTEGAVLNNSSGSGTVTVRGSNDSSRSNFNDNGWQGLVIDTNGTVSLNYVTAMGNGDKGIDVDNTSAATPKAVTAKNLNLYNNGADGLSVLSLGNITLGGINAQGNDLNGVYLNNTAGDDRVKVSISGDNYFWNSGADGLHIGTKGTAALSGIDARNNGVDGIFVNALKGISLSKSYVKNSGQDGIYLESNGAMALKDVSSFTNGSGSDGDGLRILAHQDVKVTIKSSAFMGNEGNGIYVFYQTENQPQPALTNTVYTGNDTDGSGDKNFKVVFDTP